MSDRSDELAALIADVRHEANNSLMTIAGYLELLLGQDDLPEAVVAKLKIIDAEARKLRNTIARTSSVRRPGD
jgi:signal transduction histidine kinase